MIRLLLGVHGIREVMVIREGSLFAMIKGMCKITRDCGTVA